MRILVDENIPRVTVTVLRELGHNVRDIRGTSDRGLKDPDLWSAALADHRVLVTTDRGFTEHLIVGLRQPNRLKIHNAVMLAIERFEETEWRGLLVVVRDSTLSVSRTGGPIDRQ